MDYFISFVQILAEENLDEKVRSDGFEVPTRKTQPQNTGKSKVNVQSVYLIHKVDTYKYIWYCHCWMYVPMWVPLDWLHC